MNISEAGLDLIKEFESCELDAYRCPAGIPTIGFGHTGSDVKMGMRIGQNEADALLLRDVAKFERCVNEAVTSDIDQQQYDSLVCFAFNVGCQAFKESTLLRLVNQRHWLAAADQFLRWTKAGGKELAGLVRRRQAERELFLA